MVIIALCSYCRYLLLPNALNNKKGGQLLLIAELFVPCEDLEQFVNIDLIVQKIKVTS